MVFLQRNKNSLNLFCEQELNSLTYILDQNIYIKNQKMANKLQKLFLSVLLLQQFIRSSAFLIPRDPDCKNSDNETIEPSSKCSWLLHFQRNLGKYRNFYANLLQEENEQFAAELQELYNIVSSALEEKDYIEMQRKLFYAVWLLERTKDLEDYLVMKGFNNI
ncbi:uncharacterized protein [Eurosta solidaginis]|uniref:uncharacterized protein n=1 Tax=Eurosta solidaginis TaxID=178769 RepID=UPI0035310A36